MKIHLAKTSPRSCFWRGEEASFRFDLMNFEPVTLYDVEITFSCSGIPCGKVPLAKVSTVSHDVTCSLPTGDLPSGSYELQAEIICKAGKNVITQSFRVAPPRRKEGIPLWYWPSTAHYDMFEASRETALEELKTLADAGFTVTQFRDEWALAHPEKAVELIEDAMMFGVEMGILIENAGGGLFRFMPGDPEDARVRKLDGTPLPVVDIFHPAIEARCRLHAEMLMHYFAPFPACSTIFMNSEVEDRLVMSMAPDARKRYQAELGFDPGTVPGAETFQLDGKTAPGVIPDNDPLYQLARYHYLRGDGFTRMNEILCSVVWKHRPDMITLSDPLRNCSLHGRFKHLDSVSSWTYTNPDPKASLYSETLKREAAPEHKLVVPSITLWNYAGALCPCGSDRWDRNTTLRMEPDRFSECVWLNFANGCDMIGTYFGSYFDLCLRGGDPFIYSPETEDAISRVTHGVLQPLGTLIRKSRDEKRKIAVLDSYSSRIYRQRPRPYNHYNNYCVYSFVIVLAMAHLQADVLFEEDDFSGYDVLILPECDTLTESVYERILAFAKTGKLVISDGSLRCNVPGAVNFDFDFTYRKRVNANSIAKSSNFAVTDDTNFRKDWGGNAQETGVTADEDQRRMEAYAALLRKTVDDRLPRRLCDCDSMKVLMFPRRCGDAFYLVLVNDHRVYGNRVGKWKAMLEKGVEERSVVSLNFRPGAGYDLETGKKIAFQIQGDGVQFTVTLGAASGKVLAFYPAEPGSMKAENSVLDTGFSTGIQPVEITGSGDYDGFYSAENGKLTLPCKGKFRCRCLTTGRSVDVAG